MFRRFSQFKERAALNQTAEWGRKEKMIKKIKEGGANKVQDQNMANEFESKAYGIPCPHQETDELYFETPSVEEDEKRAEIELKRRKNKALIEFRCRVEDAILGNYLLSKPKTNISPCENAKAIEQLKEITLWGVPLLPSKRHEGTDLVLSKFLKAKDFKVHEAFQMLRSTLKWRKEFKADQILGENLGPDFEKMGYLISRDREGHPVYYNIHGAFKDSQLYSKVLSSEENCQKFLRQRVQNMEKGIKQLKFVSGGADSIVQIIDMKNSPGPATKELRSLLRQAWMLFQNRYPQLIHRNILINVPFWYYVSHVLSSRLKVQRHSKIVFARPGKVAETLLKFVAPENLPVAYGGLKRENDNEFSTEDKASELNVSANTTERIQIPAPEGGVTIIWDFTVVGWEVGYKEEFVPDDEGSYRVLLQSQRDKEKRAGESVRNSFYISEPGKIVITIDNYMLKKKKVLYRYKTRPTVPVYVFLKK